MVSAANSDASGEPPRGAKEPAPRGPRLRAGALSSAPPPRRDAFAFMFAFGRRQMRVGLMIGLAGTLVVHGAAAARGLSTLLDLRDVREQRAGIQSIDRLHATYDIDMTPPPEVKAPEPEPPEPEEVKPVARAHAEPPPTPAQAAKVLTSEPDPSDAPVDLTGWGIVSGEADRFPGGATANKGTSTRPVGQAATASGAPNATGTAPAPPAPSGKDLSRAARPAEGSWNCGFPAEADMEQINSEKVLLVVTVGPDGRPQKVNVLSDPGFGFGRVARQCAMRKTYTQGSIAPETPSRLPRHRSRVRFIR